MDKYETLSHYFGYTTFREGQEALIDGILAGNDVVGIMPTGAGKSICYQVPALMLPGITLVISPLISLMKDQVGALVQSGVRAAFINSTLTPRQSELALSRAAAGQYKIVYVAPERLQTSSFLAFAQNAEISLVVVDEAHCVSQWGQNFRPSYLHIEAFVAGLPRRPVTAAFTATATGKVRADIIRLLGLRSPAVTTTGFDRANLYFEVRKPKDKFAALTSYLSLNRGKSGIVYCATRKLVEEVTDRLLGEGWQAGKYHAGMSDSERNEVQEKFIRDEIPLIVATNAFGMGIDKSNVSFVIHYNMPKNMESYYQEAGRAGRDGQPADCVLLYSGQDVRINTFLIERTFEESSEFDEETAVRLKENELELLKQMTFYSTSQYCFRKFILKYFGEHPAFENCGNCSNCMGSRTDTASRDITVEAQKILSCVRRMNESQTKWVIIDILRGTRNNRVEMCGGTRQSTFGIMRETGSRDLEKMIDALVADKYLTESHDGLLGWGSAARGVIYSGMRVTYRERQGKPDSSTRREDEIGQKSPPTRRSSDAFTVWARSRPVSSAAGFSTKSRSFCMTGAGTRHRIRPGAHPPTDSRATRDCPENAGMPAKSRRNRRKSPAARWKRTRTGGTSCRRARIRNCLRRCGRCVTIWPAITASSPLRWPASTRSRISAWNAPRRRKRWRGWAFCRLSRWPGADGKSCARCGKASARRVPDCRRFPKKRRSMNGCWNGFWHCAHRFTNGSLRLPTGLSAIRRCAV